MMRIKIVILGLCAGFQMAMGTARAQTTTATLPNSTEQSSATSRDADALNHLERAFQSLGGEAAVQSGGVEIAGTVQIPTGTGSETEPLTAKISGPDFLVQWGADPKSALSVVHGIFRSSSKGVAATHAPTENGERGADIYPILDRWTEFRSESATVRAAKDVLCEQVACREISIELNRRRATQGKFVMKVFLRTSDDHLLAIRHTVRGDSAIAPFKVSYGEYDNGSYPKTIQNYTGSILRSTITITSAITGVSLHEADFHF